ncbi:MAG: branched-chain amino acid ABC transporter permease [Rhizobiales bacterium]|nr:branched-chain amino acid ABC transporter permease [Hyphomicrobiales bacterium]
MILRSHQGLLLAVVGVGLAIAFPNLVSDRYILRIGEMVLVYWIIVAGLNLLVGYTGLMSIGHVGLLSIGGYGFAILAGKLGLDPFVALACSGALTAVAAGVLCLPSLRLPGFYFALATIAFALIMVELALGFSGLTGGTVGLSVPAFPAPFRRTIGEYWLALGIAVVVTAMTWNIAHSMWGRAMISVRDSDVAAQSMAVSIFRTKLTVFLFSGFCAGIAGALFARAQSHITPEAFNFDLSLMFFTAIIIGGRGSIVGPMLGTLLLAVIPDVFASMQRYTAFFYGGILLLVVLAIPQGLGVWVREHLGRAGERGETDRRGAEAPNMATLSALLREND